MLFGYLPRLQVLHTSEEEIGQVYVPKVNLALLVGVIFLVLLMLSVLVLDIHRAAVG